MIEHVGVKFSTCGSEDGKIAILTTTHENLHLMCYYKYTKLLEGCGDQLQHMALSRLSVQSSKQTFLKQLTTRTEKEAVFLFSLKNCYFGGHFVLYIHTTEAYRLFLIFDGWSVILDKELLSKNHAYFLLELMVNGGLGGE